MRLQGLPVEPGLIASRCFFCEVHGHAGSDDRHTWHQWSRRLLASRLRRPAKPGTGVWESHWNRRPGGFYGVSRGPRSVSYDVYKSCIQLVDGLEMSCFTNPVFLALPWEFRVRLQNQPASETS